MVASHGSSGGAGKGGGGTAAGVLLIAMGNPLRGDDGVAHQVAAGLGSREGVVIRHELQLLPELAAEFAPFHTVVFVDADVAAGEVTVERVVPAHGLMAAGRCGHHARPELVAGLAVQVFGWRGSAWLCRIPVVDFKAGASLSATAVAGVQEASRCLERLL